MRTLSNAALILFILFGLMFSYCSNISMAVSYDYEGHWAEQTIKIWIEKGYIKMYEDGTFRPDDPITRAEFVSMINKLFGLTETGTVGFNDVAAKDWYYNAVLIARKAGYIVGKENNTFGPNDKITREEASTMLGRVMGMGNHSGNKNNHTLKDFDQVSEFAKLYLDDLMEKELIQGYGDNTFRPQDYMSRGEAVVVIDRAANLLKVDRTYYANKVAVLMYHSIRTDYKYDNCINVDVFRQQLKMLINSKFNIISLNTFLDFMEGKTTVPENAVLLTFDDGYEDFYKLAYPVLEEFNLPATMFVITSKIGDKSGWNPKIDETQMKDMNANNISFQSHSHDGHYYVKGLFGKEDAFLVTRIFNNNYKLEDAKEYHDRVYNDLLKSKQVLDALLAQDTRVMAAPYGKVNKTVEQVANLVGLDYNFTIKPGVVGQQSNMMRLPRINAGYSSISDEELKNVILRIAR